MVSHTGRLYSLALALVVFFLAWAVVAAHPWGATASDPRLKALATREAQLRHEARLVNQVVALRWAAYRSALKARTAQIAAAKATGDAAARVRIDRIAVRDGARRHAAAADGHEDVVMQRRTFHAMGTEMELLVDAHDAEAELDAAEAEFHRLEALLSRFRDDSELSQLNRDGSIEAGPDLLRVVKLALAARRRTGGRFDPTVHDAVVAAGYDRSFEDVAPEGDTPCATAAAGGGVSVVGSLIALDPGVHVDLGGIGKGYAAERAAELLALAGPCLVNAGGDIATRGGSWPVGVETDGAPLTLELAGAALATSGRDRRRWRREGRELHHLIDPRTGAPSETDLLRVTVVAPDAVEAEVTAKSLFLAGADGARAEADAAGIAAVLTTETRTVLAGGLA